MPEFISSERQDNGVELIRFNRPPYNALSSELLTELADDVEALAMGLVDRVVPVQGYLDAALEWAASFASGAVVAMGLSKRAIDGGLDGPLAEGLDLERTLFGRVLATEDAARGITSFFEN